MIDFQTLRHGVVAAFREQLSGRLVSPADAGYDKARRVWNGRIDRRPALIAFCASDREVMAAVRFAREDELLVAVRSGGHSAAGTAVCNGGLVIDLSLMKSIEVDVAARTVNAQGGVLWGDLDRTTQSFGMVLAVRILKSALPD
jgi:FAD/FMN-containing dehydrogenase